MYRHPIRCGAATSPTFGLRGNGIIWLSCWIFARAGWWARHCRKAGRLVGYQGTGYGLRATWKVSGPTVSLRSRVAVRESFISPAAVALSNALEHELLGKLLEQCADGARVPQLESKRLAITSCEQLIVWGTSRTYRYLFAHGIGQNQRCRDRTMDSQRIDYNLQISRLRKRATDYEAVFSRDPVSF